MSSSLRKAGVSGSSTSSTGGSPRKSSQPSSTATSARKGKTAQQAAQAQADAEAAAAAAAASSAEADEQYYFEEVSVPAEDPEEDGQYAEVPVDSGEAGEDLEENAYAADAAGDDEDYHSLVASLKNTKTSDVLLPAINNSTAGKKKSGAGRHSQSNSLTNPSTTSPLSPTSSSSSLTPSPAPTPSDIWLQRKLKVWNLRKTLEMFQAEWADLKDAGALPSASQIGSVPHESLTSHASSNEAKLQEMERELGKTGGIAVQARESWEKLKRERDYHRMHHSRVLQEKEILIRDLKRLKKHYESFEPTLAAMKQKYEAAMKDKMMMRLERDRCKVKADALEAQMRAFEQAQGNVPEQKESDEAKAGAADAQSKKLGTTKKSRTGHPKDSPLPSITELASSSAATLRSEQGVEPTLAYQFQLRKTFKGHRQAISAMCLHPKKSILCTVSDDQTWKMWSIPKGELIMSGEGHKDWISSCEFHPGGNLLATGSGDGTVKMWDFMKASCAATYAEHTQAVWDVAFHDSGDFFVSGSMDQTSKLWDVNSQRCRQTFRGHVDSVNSVCFQPGTNALCTASGDKTVSLWDLRSGLCVQTFYGHQNAVTHASFNTSGDTIISSDADGVVKMWDVRTVGERANFRSMGNQAINEARIDRSGRVAALASDDGTIKIFSTADGKHLGDLEGHEDAVQSVLFDPNGQFLISASSDQTFRIWS